MRIVHILPEAETFSRTRGGALSRWAGCVVQQSPLPRMVVSHDADQSWENVPCLRTPRFVDAGRLIGRFRGAPLWQVRRLLWMGCFAYLRPHLSRDDVLYVHNRPEMALALAGLRWLWRLPLGVALHMHNDHLAVAPVAVRKAVFANVDAMIFCSQFLRSQAKVPPAAEARAHVLYNAADPSLFYPGNAPKPQPPVVLFVGRLWPEKGAHVFLEAMRLLWRDGCPAQARVVGAKWWNDDPTDPYLKSLRAQVAGLEDRVSFAGFRTGTALADEYRRATVFCCPSVWNEPFGMVNVEAMGCGIPVVAARAGGIPEIFGEGGGLLVPPKDPPAMAQAIQRLLTDKALADELGRQGRIAFERRFNWPHIAGQYTQLMQRLFSRA
jgi:glycosyltransferase involved in cell wall biosynthesis